MSFVINGSTGISGVDGTSVSPSLKGGDGDTGIHFAENQASISTDGTTRLVINANGKLTQSGDIESTGSLTVGTTIAATGNINSSQAITATGNITSSADIQGSALIDSTGPVRRIVQNAKTSSYTLTASDAGKHISITTGGVTIPSNIFSVGDAVSLYNNSTAGQTITQGTNAVVRVAGAANTGNRTLAQFGLCTVLCVGTNEFVIGGAGVS